MVMPHSCKNRKNHESDAIVICELLPKLKTERCHSFIAVRNFVTVLRQKPRDSSLVSDRPADLDQILTLWRSAQWACCNVILLWVGKSIR